MRGTILSICLLWIFAASPAKSDQPPAQLSDATLCAKPAAGGVVLLGEKGLEGWVRAHDKSPANWHFADGILRVGHGDIMTGKTFGCFTLHVEFNIPYMPNDHGQGGETAVFT